MAKAGSNQRSARKGKASSSDEDGQVTGKDKDAIAEDGLEPSVGIDDNAGMADAGGEPISQSGSDAGDGDDVLNADNLKKILASIGKGEANRSADEMDITSGGGENHLSTSADIHTGHSGHSEEKGKDLGASGKSSSQKADNRPDVPPSGRASEVPPPPSPRSGTSMAPPPPPPSAGGEVVTYEELAPQAPDNGWRLRATSGGVEDTLASCLSSLCALLDRPISVDALTSGLPLAEGRLTPDLFARAASRAGVSARLVKRRIEQLNRLSLPCVLLLKDKQAAILTHVGENGIVRVILPDMGIGERTVELDTLAKEYIGYAFIARPEFIFDDRAGEEYVPDPKGWFWGTVFGSWKLYIEVMVAAVLVNSFAIASPLFVMNVYDRVVPNFAQETLWVLAIGVVTVYVFDFLLKLTRGYLVDVAGKSADTKIAARLFQQMLSMKMANRPPSAGAMANQLREFESIREFFTSSTLATLVDAPFIFLFLAVVALVGTWKIVIIPAAIIVVVILVGLLLQIPMQRVVRDTQREAQQKHAILVEAISGIETVKSTASESRMQRNWEIFVGRTARSAMLATRWSQVATMFSGLMMQLVSVGVIFMGVYEIHNGNMSVGALVACNMLATRALSPLSQLAAIATRFHQARQALIGLNAMMAAPVERPDGRRFVQRPKFAGHIEFKGVSFTYPNAESKALNEVSFNIQPGEKVGIVGRIGSGKSTIERLVLGLYEPDEGAVLIDGIDTRQLDPADLRRNVGVVPQDNYLFYGTVRENISMGAPFVDDSAILRAARISGVDEFLSKSPLGFDLQVGERGQSLSGGQRQAIAIARSLLLDPPILVFDEPTSSMDNTTEGRFKARLNTILPGKTLVMITHRGSLLSLVDRLIVLDGGRVVADGPKDTVLEALTSGRIPTARD